MKFIVSVGFLLASLLLVLAPTVNADPSPPLANAVILIIRHAEKQPDGPGLTPPGIQRANLYVHYFKTYQIGGTVRPPDVLYAAADSKSTERCRLTITPLSQALGIPINSSFKNKDVDGIAQALAQNPGGKTILICWHHEEIANLLKALGADPNTLIPLSGWPEDRYNWLIELHYDSSGNLEPALDTRITEHVLPTDSE